MPLQLRLLVAVLAVLSLLAARHLHRRQQAASAVQSARLRAPSGTLPTTGRRSSQPSNAPL